MKYLDFFEEVYYINLDYRTDRRELFEKRAKEAGIVDLIRFPAIQPNIGDCGFNEETLKHPDLLLRRNQAGCSMSHLAIIKSAKERNVKNVLIFEDDCIFLDGFKEKAQKCADDLKKIDWDILYFGGEPNYSSHPISDNLSMMGYGGVYCLHAYAINNSFYDLALTYNVLIEDNKNFDAFVLNLNLHFRKCVLSKELLAIQDVNYSDLKGFIPFGVENLMRNGWKRFVC